MKELYTITVNKKEKIEVKTENGDGSFTLKYEDKLTPVKVFLKQPSRRDREEMDMVYTAELQKCVARGILTSDLIRRALIDGGGSLSNLDLEEMDSLLKEIQEKNNIYQKLKLDKVEDEKITEIESELSKLIERYNTIEQTQFQHFSRSAESYAQKKTVIWSVLNLSYTQEGNNYSDVFRGPTFDSKLNNYYDYCEEEDKYDFELKTFDKAYVIYHGFLTGAAKDKEDFAAVEANLDELEEERIETAKEIITEAKKATRKKTVK